MLNYGAGENPVLTYVAPPYANTELGRQKVDSMIGKGRLHIEHLDLHYDLEQAAKAIQYAVCWAQESPAMYRQKRASGPLDMMRPAGVVGL